MEHRQPFERVVAAHGAAVLRVCRALLPAADAEDAWSETFLAALAAYPKLDPAANFEAWLVTIAHRKAIDSIRARTRRPSPTDLVPEVSPAQGDQDAASERVWRHLNQLPTKQRRAVAYHYLGGLPYREVAEIVGGTPGAARRAAADGMARLRVALSNLADEEEEQ